ncbi:MAG: DNA topoisomerase IB [Ilumatobacter sp.]|nr:DNA topoisomerase IB [Ilumatobacter sp.]
MAVRVPRDLLTRDPAVIAPLAGLRYLPPEPPGWTRRRRGRGFSFVDEHGTTITSPDRDRLVDLAVPPAWEDVWFAPIADGYLQATGVDDAGRKQYRYHDDYRAVCEARKFDRIRYFGRALPALRTYIEQSLAAPPGSKRLAVGAVLGVIDAALLRIGNEQSAEDGHHGATTLAADHVDDDGHVVLEYVAKSGKHRSVVIDDEQLGDVMRSLADADDERLFSYTDADGDVRNVTAIDVNAVIADVAGPAFSAKDFRTWGGSRTALEARADGLSSIASIDATAEALGNTRTVARNSYVHPDVLDAPDDEIDRVWRASRRSSTMSRGDSALVKLLGR